MRKAATSFVMSILLSARMEQLGVHCTDIKKIDLIIFRLSTDNI